MGLFRIVGDSRLEVFSDSRCWLGRRPAGMAKSYSKDLRERVVEAVEREGMSRRGAAARFGVGIKTAIDWVRQYRETGRLSALRRGGRRPKKLVGAPATTSLCSCAGSQSFCAPSSWLSPKAHRTLRPSDNPSCQILHGRLHDTDSPDYLKASNR